MSDDFGQEQAIRKLGPGRLVIASHNPGKVREIGELLAPYGIETVHAAALDLPETAQTGTPFIASAELTAIQAAALSGIPALAEHRLDARRGVQGCCKTCRFTVLPDQQKKKK